MPMATITKVSGERNLYHIHVLDPHEGHPDQGLPGSEVDPGYGRPVRPNCPDQGLPGQGGHPSHPIHGGHPVFPDNSLPDHEPPTMLPGYTLVMVRGPHGKWEYAAIQPGSPPPRPLPPGQPGHPDQGLPPAPGQGLPQPPQPPPVAGQLPGQTPQPR